MKLLDFYCRLTIDFDAPVEHHSFAVRGIPQDNAMQRIDSLQWRAEPADFLGKSRDQWGNLGCYGSYQGQQTHFEADFSGQAATGLARCLPVENEKKLLVFCHQTALTMPDASIRALGAGLNDPVELMGTVHSALVYAPGTTNVSTTAAQALAQGSGVCQDYSHILLSLLRSRGIPCRYVTGMLLGEGASHAWVEVLEDGHWLALDPTNNQIVTDQHIKLSHGRDAADCPLNRGVFRGAAGQRTEIKVIVNEVNGEGLRSAFGTF